MTNTITNEIRIHDAIGNASLIGAQAIRLRFNPAFQAPSIPGFHLYGRNSQLLKTLNDYQLAIDTARQHNSTFVWREDLNQPDTTH
jgi:hypothetical protein